MDAPNDLTLSVRCRPGAVSRGAWVSAYYHVFARQLDADATAELREMTRAVHGYLRFRGRHAGPGVRPGRSRPGGVCAGSHALLPGLRRRNGDLLVQSPALEPLGLHYTPGEVHSFVEHPAVFDVQTDQRRIRFSNSLVSPAAGERIWFRSACLWISATRPFAGF